MQMFAALSLSLLPSRFFSFSVRKRNILSIQVQPCAQAFASFNSFMSGNKLFRPKVSKITITFKNKLDRKSESELLGFGFGYKFVLYQPSSHGPQANGNARKTRVNIRLGCQVKEWLEFRWDSCERRCKYARSLIHQILVLKDDNDNVTRRPKSFAYYH